MPRCPSRPAGQMDDGWTEGQMDDGWTEGQMERWMELFARLLYSPVSVVAALTAARAFAVFKNTHSISNHQTPNFRLYNLEIKAYLQNMLHDAHQSVTTLLLYALSTEKS